MKFKEDSGIDKMKEMMIKSIETDEAYEFMRDDQRYIDLVKQEMTID